MISVYHLWLRKKKLMITMQFIEWHIYIRNFYWLLFTLGGCDWVYPGYISFSAKLFTRSFVSLKLDRKILFCRKQSETEYMHSGGTDECLHIWVIEK